MLSAPNYLLILKFIANAQKLKGVVIFGARTHGRQRGGAGGAFGFFYNAAASNKFPVNRTVVVTCESEKREGRRENG